MNPSPTADEPSKDEIVPAIPQEDLVLVVDDDKITQALVKKVLEQLGYQSKTAGSAAEALDALKDSTPELILCDINMPEVDGLTFCRELKEDPEHKDIPIIFFTGCKDSETLRHAFAAGAHDYVVKPIRKAELQSRAQRQIEDFRARRDAAAQIDALHHRNTSKTRFLSVASHDLRNPLASIRGIGQYLASNRFGELNESQHEMVRTIIEASENMLGLVEELLDVSKIELDHFDLNCKPIPAAEIAQNVITLHAPTAETKGSKLEYVDKSRGSKGNFDKRLITRVIENLVTNALKFSPSETTVTVETHIEGANLCFSVKDQGPGIPPDEFSRLFKEFSRTSNLPTAGESTSGIGLFVVKRIVESHGGKITARNLPNGGAHFKAIFKRIP